MVKFLAFIFCGVAVQRAASRQFEDRSEALADFLHGDAKQAHGVVNNDSSDDLHVLVNPSAVVKDREISNSGQIVRHFEGKKSKTVEQEQSTTAWRFLRHTTDHPVSHCCNPNRDPTSGYNLCSQKIELYDASGSYLTPNVVSEDASTMAQAGISGRKVFDNSARGVGDLGSWGGWCNGDGDTEQWVQAEFNPPVAFAQWRTYMHSWHVASGTLILEGSQNGVDWNQLSVLDWGDKTYMYRWSGMGNYTFVEQAPASAVGDPHLQNIHGERFDLMKPGNFVLINIPHGQPVEDTLLAVEAGARQLGGDCADMYFVTVNVTGAWADKVQAGGLHFHAYAAGEEKPTWVKFGRVELKVAHGRTEKGIQYLNVYVKHLGQAGFAVGGLLGEDDHEDVSKPPSGCTKRVSLRKDPSGASLPAAPSTAVASMA
jgi:hypothetical protein